MRQASFPSSLKWATLLCLVALIILMPSLVLAQTQTTVSINAGGSATGSFTADQYFSGGSTYTNTATIDMSQIPTNPPPAAVFNTERYGAMTYTIPNRSGAQTVTLYFAETYLTAAGQRLFNVSINGTSVLSNFDLYASAGGANRAIARTFNTTANSSGQVVIQFTAVTENPKINGITVAGSGGNPTSVPPTSVPPTGVPPTGVPPTGVPPTSISINAGGSATGSFTADQYFSGGSTYTNTATIDVSQIPTNPPPAAVFNTERYGAMTYTIPNRSGEQTVTLYFAETYLTAAGQRLFNVTINGSTVLSSFDIYASAGGQNRAIARTFNTTANSSGQVVIQFTAVTENPKINGITVAGSGGNPTQVPPTGVPPTGVPPTSVPPTNIPPTTSPGQAPYSGTPAAIPGTIQAEDYDTGGEGVAYHDTTSGNSGNAYRTDGVDVESTTDSGGGYNVGWTEAGEWLEYTVNVTAGGTYTLNARVASQSSGGTLHVEFDGVNVTGALAIPSTGGWQTWTTVTKSGLSLAAGQHVMRVAEDSAGFNINWVSLTSGTPPPTTPPPQGRRQMEDLNRGVARVWTGSGNFVSWRMLGTDPSNIAFNLYRGSTLVNGSPITNSTNYLDSGGSSSSTYTVRPVINGQEQASSEGSLNLSTNYLSIPLQIPAGGTTPDGVAYTYSANDASVGDLDGDGQYEVILKWDPSNAKDNSQSGYTGNVYIDAYKLNGTRMWRIDLGRNIRAGAHYTQFLVYDFDGDGSAEIAMKTADGTRDGGGTVIGSSTADYRNSSGYVLSGPEFLTVFDGETGRALSTVNYEPARGTVSSWGDDYGNRVDRFLATVAYLDGARPSLVFTRGYYTRTVLVAWDFRNGSLTRRWTFDSNSAGSQYTGQGNHNLSAGDADGDGRDEIMFGAMAIDDNGQPMWNTGYGHGDAMHFGDLIPSRAGLEVFKIDEDGSKPTDWMGDARTGQIIWSHPASGGDNGRGVSDDIWAGSAGAESWSSSVSGLTSAGGQNIGRKPSSTNFLAWWDADPVRELLDGTHIDKYGTSSDTNLLTAGGVHSNNGTKSTPSLSADIFGDWREEVIWPTTDNSALRIYTTTNVTTTRIYTLMHDPIYRLGIAWQNVAYNQPPHTGFFLGNGMAAPPVPDIYLR